jgi:hypothetical protein
LAWAFPNPAAATDLISFLKALPDCRMRRGIRFPQWWMLLGPAPQTKSACAESNRKGTAVSLHPLANLR